MTGSLRHHDTQRRAVWPPQPGWFKVRLVSRGWAVPAQIMQDNNGLLCVILDGTAHEWVEDAADCPTLTRVWHYGYRIDQAEYTYLLAVKDWAERTKSPHPCLTPMTPVDPALLPVVRSYSTK